MSRVCLVRAEKMNLSWVSIADREGCVTHDPERKLGGECGSGEQLSKGKMEPVLSQTH